MSSALIRKAPAGLRVLGVAELPEAVRVAPGLEDAARGVGDVEAMFRVGGEGAAEGLQLRGEAYGQVSFASEGTPRARRRRR